MPKPGLGRAEHLNRLALAGGQGKLPVRMRGDIIEIPSGNPVNTRDLLKMNTI